MNLTKRKYDSSIIASRIKELRKERGITQQQLADGAHIGLSTVKQYESQKRIPDSYNLTQIAQYFDVLEKWITGESDHKTVYEMYKASIIEDTELYQQLQARERLIDYIDFIGFETDLLLSDDVYNPAVSNAHSIIPDIQEYIEFKCEKALPHKQEGKEEHDSS